MKKYQLHEVLDYIDPALLDYQEWLSVGMALKDAGYDVSTWDTWSTRDINRYHAGECGRKWNGFRGSSNPVTTGTVVQMAKDQGWMPEPENDHELDWNDEIGGHKDDLVILNPAWVEGREIHEPEESAWNPVGQLIKYLETLFEASENVGYVCKSWTKDDKPLPTQGFWDRTAGELIQALSQCKGDIGSVLGDWDEKAGAWIRFNPLDGKGCKDINVTSYRYALVESDTVDIEKQHAIIRELELPVACLVHSGKKSIHAIVRVDAANYEEYRKRVDYLYDVCKKNGLIIDSQNRNPSRLSRMPGITRNGQKQFLIDTNIGKDNWKEWQEWIESVNDDLPDPEDLAGIWDHLPELSPPLIDNVLRQGHKMLLAGPSKAGKSYALIEMAIAIAEGGKWLQWSCTKGRVMYVNLELDRASCLHRFKDVYAALGWQPDNLQNIDIWNLRGKSVPMDKLAPKLIRRAAKKNYIAIIIDPIYKVITGDENSADQMAHFCNQFDRVCTELGCAVIYCHHHSKGSQGGKRSMDRASGSGVFARDPDVLLDLIELELTEDLLKQEENKAVCAVCVDTLKAQVANWETEVSQDDQCSEKAMMEACRKLLDKRSEMAMLDKVYAARQAVRQRTAWRIDGTLREFPKFSPVNLWFTYPVHRLDEVGSLQDIDAEGEVPSYLRGARSTKEKAKKKAATKSQKLEQAINNCNFGSPATKEQVAEFMEVEPDTVRKWLANHPKYYIDKNDGLIKEKDNSDG